jgi:hypothetical protein
MTQTERLKEALTSGHKITRLTALVDLGIFELSARIGELEKQGFGVTKTRITVVNRFGEKISCMEYSNKIKKLPRVWRQIDK